MTFNFASLTSAIGDNGVVLEGRPVLTYTPLRAVRVCRWKAPLWKARKSGLSEGVLLFIIFVG